MTECDCKDELYYYINIVDSADLVFSVDMLHNCSVMMAYTSSIFITVEDKNDLFDLYKVMQETNTDTYEFFNIYSGSSSHRITITGDSILWLFCRNNQLTALDVSRNTALAYLFCNDNQLKVLNVSLNTGLVYLSCYYNQLTALNISKNTLLRELFCDGNLLTTLDLSKNTALRRLSCSRNSLTKLDVSRNTELYYLWCVDCHLTTPALNDLFRKLPYHPNAYRVQSARVGSPPPMYTLDIAGNPGESYCDRSIVRARGWGFYEPVIRPKFSSRQIDSEKF